MARARLLKPGFFTNKALASIPPFGRLLFAGLWTLADKQGRLKDSPKFIEGSLFPYDKVPVNKLLDQLAGFEFIRRYKVDGDPFIQILHFTDHQTPNSHEPDSNIPAPMVEQCTDDAHAMHMQSIPRGRAAVTVTVTEAVMETVTEAKAETAPAFSPNLEPPFPDEPGFLGEYVRHYERLHGKPCSSSQMADAAELERSFGLEACLRAARDTNWEKPPKWLRPKIEERLKEKSGPSLRYQNGLGAPKPSLRYEART